jgi:hypothetical protein
MLRAAGDRRVGRIGPRQRRLVVVHPVLERLPRVAEPVGELELVDGGDDLEPVPVACVGVCVRRVVVADRDLGELVVTGATAADLYRPVLGRVDTGKVAARSVIMSVYQRRTRISARARAIHASRVAASSPSSPRAARPKKLPSPSS